MERTFFEQGGQKIRLDDFQRIENDKYTAIQGLGEVLYTNTILSGCTITITPSGPNFIWNITSGVCYVNGYGVVRFPANSFTSTFSNVSTAYCYIKQEYNPVGTTIFQDNTTHQTWYDTIGYFYTTDQNTTGLVNKGLKSSFNGTLPNTYASKTLYNATAATVAAIPSTYQNIAGMSSYTTNAVANATYRRITDSYTKAETNALLTPYETSSHASATYNTISAFNTYVSNYGDHLPLLWAGYIAPSGYVTKRRGSLTLNASWSNPDVIVTHNFGSYNYFVIAIPVGTTSTSTDSIKAATVTKSSNSFTVWFGDDSSAYLPPQGCDIIMYTW